MASPRSTVAVVLTASVAVHAAVALARHRWPSAAAAAVVAALLWWRHPRARFAAYVLFTVLAARAALRAEWALLAYALVAVALMQTPAAQAAWPRLTRGRLRDRDDRMRRS